MNDWKVGDPVVFTLTGTIAKVNGDMVFINTFDAQYIVNASQIFGTPETAKRERILATLRQEFSGFTFEPARDNGQGIIINCAGWDYEALQEPLKRINARITEMEEQS